MNRSARAVIAVAALLGATGAGQPPMRCRGGDAASCRLILRATQALAQMLATSDPAPLRRHLDRRALWVTARGEVRDGVALIATVRSDRPRRHARLDAATVDFFGHTAVVRWAESWRDPGGPVVAGRLAGVDTWSRRGGRWQLVATIEQPPRD